VIDSLIKVSKSSLIVQVAHHDMIRVEMDPNSGVEESKRERGEEKELLLDVRLGRCTIHVHSHTD